MDVGLLILRFVVGLTLAAHGAQKLFGSFGGYGLDGTGQFMEALGFQPGRRHAALAGLTEAGGGVLLALGLLTPLGAALIASVMLVATITVHLKNGFFAASGGYEYNLVLAAAASTRLYSYPPLAAKKPFLRCTVIVATSITEATRAAPSGVSRPSASNTPPPVSVRPASAAWRRPGWKPSVSMNWPVPSRP